MAERLALDRYDRLHHFISDGIWEAGPLEAELAVQADRIVGASDAFLVIDDTALPKKGDHSVGVAPQYASMLGKRANCQTLVSLTLARDEVPVPVGLRLFLPESWTSDQDRMAKAGVPAPMRISRTKPEIAIDEIDRLIAAGMRFGTVLPDAGYGLFGLVNLDSLALGVRQRGLDGVEEFFGIVDGDVDPLGYLESNETRKLEGSGRFFLSDSVKFSNAHGSFRTLEYIVRSRHMSVEQLSNQHRLH